MKKLLRWLGGKAFLAPKIKPLLIDGSRWVDVFCGGCSLPLELGLTNVLANDINHHLISFYHWVKWGQEFSVEFENSPQFYYQARTEFNETGCPELFYYLNQTGVNGLIRYNLSGEFNTPYGGTGRNINYQIDQKYSGRIKSWEFSCRSYKKVFEDLIPGDTVFIDPPYDSEDGKGFVNYFGNFSYRNQVEVATLASKVKGQVIATNKATPRMVKLYSSLGFQIEFYEAPRKVATNGDRRPVTEMLATKRFDL